MADRAAGGGPLIAFARHGETAPNVAGTLLGRADAALTERGIVQAGALAALFRTEPVVAVVSSPLQRAVQTAAAIAAEHGLGVEIEDDLIELDYGAWEGSAPADLDPNAWRHWQRAPGWAPPGGESLTHLAGRVAGACERLAGLVRVADGATVVAVTHVSPVKAAVSWALGVGPEIAWRTYVRVASVTRIGVGPGEPRLLSFNETGHLPG